MHRYFEVIFPNHELDEKKSHFQLFVYHHEFLELKKKCNVLITEEYNLKNSYYI